MYQNKQISFNKAMVLLLSVLILLTTVFSGTFAQLITKTPSFINTFLSGIAPSGNLVISKNVTHPFGDSYTIPEELGFAFSVALGESYAGKTVNTSRGDVIADENGNITLSIGAGKAVCIYDLEDGTVVAVTESSVTGFTPENGAEKTIVIQRGEENHISYINDYKPNPIDFTDLTGGDANLTVGGTKMLEGREWQEGDSFTLQLEYKLANEQEWKLAGTTSVAYELTAVTNPETQEVHYEPKPDFDKFSFTELVQGITYNTAGEYSFRISEVEGTVGGITYDKVVSYFDVIVGDADMDGYLEIQNVNGYQNAVTSYDTLTNSYHVDVTVNNKYAPAGTASAIINIRKHVESYSGEEKTAAGYTFELYDESENIVAISGETSAAGETSIELFFEAKDTDETYHYILKESHCGETINGVVYADTEYPISVSIVDNLDGTISAYVYSTDVYQTELVEIETEKIKTEALLLEQPESDDVIEYTDSGAAYEDATPEEIESEQIEIVQTETALVEIDQVNNETITAAIESVAIPEIEANEMEEQETIPVVSEDADSVTSEKRNIVVLNDKITEVSVDGNTETVNEEIEVVSTTLVTESKKIVIIPNEATNSYPVSFVNVYDPDDAAVSFGGIKELTGRALKEGEFAFELYATDANFNVNEYKAPVQSVANGADGKFEFDAIDYDKIGTYRYKVREDTSGNLNGITYDEAVFFVTVTVTDENGILSATPIITDELGCETDLVFRNSYKALPVSISFTGSKILNGMELKADMFRFLLYKADKNYNVHGAAMAGTYNDAFGNFKFDNIICYEAGTFFYVVKEDLSADVEGMTYDDTVFGIKVDVWDDGTGNLKTEFVITEVGGSDVEEIVFENSYKKPEESDELDKPIVPDETVDKSDTTDSMESDKLDAPETGDSSNVGLYLTVIIISILMFIVLLVVSKKNKQKDIKHE